MMPSHTINELSEGYDYYDDTLCLAKKRYGQYHTFGGKDQFGKRHFIPMYPKDGVTGLMKINSTSPMFNEFNTKIYNQCFGHCVFGNFCQGSRQYLDYKNLSWNTWFWTRGGL